MQHAHYQSVSSSLDQSMSRELGKLIRKLRWIGMEQEAWRLELVLSALPPENREIPAEPLGTD
jgi:hypothetical protein